MGLLDWLFGEGTPRRSGPTIWLAVYPSNRHESAKVRTFEVLGDADLSRS